MAFSKIKVGGLADSGVTTAKIADDAVVASKVDDDGTGYTVGNLTNSGTLQQTGQVTIGTGSGSGGSFTLPTSRGANDKYVLQIDTAAGAANWVESLVAPEISSHNFDVSGSTDDGGINAYEAPYAVTGTTTNASTTISAITTTNIKAGQYISGAGIPANTTVSSISSAGSSNNGTIVISNQATAAASGVALKIQKTPGEKNGGKVILSGTNFGTNIADISVAITNSAGAVIANASYLSGLSGGTSITAEWTGTEGSYSTELTSSYTGKIYFKITKSGLASNVHDTNTTLEADPSVTTLSGSSQTGGDVSTDPSATSLGTYGSGRTAGGAQDSDTKLLLNFDRNGGTDIEDLSNIGGDGHKVTVTNQAKIKSTPFGDGKSAIKFDGTGDYLSTTLASGGIGSGDFTLDFWFQPTGAGGSGAYHNVIDQRAASGFANGILLQYVESSRKLRLYTAVTTSFDITGDKVLTLNQWHHIAIVRDAGTFIRVYIDGVLDISETTSGKTNHDYSNTGFVVGASADTSTRSEDMQGYIDELRLVLGETIFTSDFTPSQYRYGTTGATHEASSSSNVKLLIHSDQEDYKFWVRNPTIDGPIPSVTNARSTWGGSSWYFDGTNDFISFPASEDLAFGTGDFTLEAWIYSTSWSHTSYINLFDFRNADGDADAFWLGFEGNDGSATDGRLYMYHANGVKHLDSANEAFPINEWHHMALTRVGATITAYIDGVATGTTYNIGGSTSLNAENTVFISRYFNSNQYNFKGYLEDIRFTKGLAVYTGNFNIPTGPLTTTWSANPYGTAGSKTGQVANTDASKVKLLIHGDGGKFTDSSEAPLTIAATNSYHCQGHGGIAPAMPWPANGKSTGSAGIYLDGSEDDVNINATTELSRAASGSASATNFTFECWFYMTAQGSQSIFETRDSDFSPQSLYVNIQTQGYMFVRSTTSGGMNFNGSGTEDIGNSRFYPHLYEWYHLAVSRSGSNMRVYVNGRYLAKADDSNLATVGAHAWGLGHSQSGDEFTGYIDQVRWSNTARYTHETLGSGNWPEAAMPQPTRVYGAYGQDTPDVGTITLTGTGDGDFTWSEVAGGTALPGTLAVGSTTHSGSGNSRTHTATITGTLPVNASTTYTNGVKGDLATNGILLKVQHDTDATKAITLGSSGGYDGIGITQKSTEKPVLFNARRYTGNSAVRDINGYGFQPDLVWFKSRSNAYQNAMYDSLRGPLKVLITNINNAQATHTNTLTAFNSDGLSTGTDGDTYYINQVDKTYIAWAWKAGGAPSGSLGTIDSSTTSGAGTIANDATGVSGVTSITQSVNRDSGFSITRYTGGGGAAAAFPHNLGATPDWIIIKRFTDGTKSWVVWHKDLTNATNSDNNVSNLYLDLDAAQQSATGGQHDHGAISGPSNSVINVRQSGNVANVNDSSKEYICYAWKTVPGLSAFGTYNGAGSAQTITTNFAPRFLLIKRINAGGNWFLVDSFRGADGTGQLYFEVESNAVEQSSSTLTATLTSTGFTTGTHGGVNTSGGVYVYMAFA